LDKLATDAGYAKVNDFLADIGNGKIGPRQLASALRPETVFEPGAEKALVTHRVRSTSKDSVLVVGVDKLLTLPARCCKPVPPDPIVGFVTRGRGVSVHRANCANVRRLDARRKVRAEWGQAQGVTFPVEIEIEALDRTGLLRDISDVLSRERINVTATHSLSSKLTARMRFTIEVTDGPQLKRALAMIREVRGVLGAARR
ncbi:MAG TPA: ACT domain-containing protein, partial [Burkholderiales bacterium]|nr:ACT domain-containing protein [Burkholderiales bacterium]